METSIPVVPYMGNYGNNNDGFGWGGIMGGLVLGSLLGRGGFGGGFGNGFGGGFWGPASSAVASEVVLTPTLNAIQSQISTLAGQVGQNEVKSEIDELESAVSNGFNNTNNIINQHQDALAAIRTALADGNFQTLNSINGLGRDIIASNTQNLIQNLNSFNVLSTAVQTGFNNAAMQTATATNQLIAGQNALSWQLANCCCEIKETIKDDGNLTRALINANKLSEVEDALAQARLEASQQAQTNALIAALNSNGNGNGNSAR